MIDQKNRAMADMRNNESMADKAFIENNNAMARAMADQKAMIKKTQQQVLRDGNLEMMRMKKEMEHNDMANRREKTSTTIGPVGDGYQQQLANMQRADAINSMAYANYQQSIGSPSRDKAMKLQ